LKEPALKINPPVNSSIDQQHKSAAALGKWNHNKSARITPKDNTSLVWDFHIKGANKPEVVVQHLQLAGCDNAAAIKFFWATLLSQLKAIPEA
jgi:hypothetical protein